MDFNLLQKYILYSPKRFFNREVSLLKFHERVLAQTAKSSFPVLERLRFLSISGSNLDEFCMVRYAALKTGRKIDDENISIDGLSFKEQIKLAYPVLKSIKEKQFQLLTDLKIDLARKKILFSEVSKLGKRHITTMEGIFKKHIQPTLIIHDADEQFPFLENLTFNILVDVSGKRKIISLPRKFQRFFPIIPETKGKINYVLMEDMILHFLDKLFPKHTTKAMAVFTIHRDSLIAFEEKPENIITWFEEAIQKRKQGKITLLEIKTGADISGVSYLVKNLKLDEYGVISSDFLGYRHFNQIINSSHNKLLFKEYTPRKSEQVKKAEGDYFNAIAKEDILVHHPYESYEIVVNFLKQAAYDKDVISIKQTLYRTNKESPIMYALIDAAKNGKDVTAFIELRARFDEEANLEWAKILKKHGVKVIFGHHKYKFHGKISLVRRKVKGKIKSYVHYGTGNYNPVTANIYTDLSFFTCNKTMCDDADLLFDFLKTNKKPQPFKKLVIAPYYLQSTLLDLIEKEIAFAKQGKPATIIAKANSLMDDVIIDAFYRASIAGVKIKLIIRGICALRPGIKGLSENITVKSIVGRFLEHSRIYCFGNGDKMSPTSAKVFISSADLMRRNMVKRIETLIPMENAKIKKQILNQIIHANLKDSGNSWALGKDMEYSQISTTSTSFNAQRFFMDNPSLAIRGSTAKLKRRIKKTK